MNCTCEEESTRSSRGRVAQSKHRYIRSYSHLCNASDRSEVERAGHRRRERVLGNGAYSGDSAGAAVVMDFAVIVLLVQNHSFSASGVVVPEIQTKPTSLMHGVATSTMAHSPCTLAGNSEWTIMT